MARRLSGWSLSVLLWWVATQVGAAVPAGVGALSTSSASAAVPANTSKSPCDRSVGATSTGPLAAQVARLRAQAYGSPLVFESETPADAQKRERASYEQSQKELTDGLSRLRSSKAQIDKEIKSLEPMVAQGLVSNLEVLRMKRQSNDMAMQITERRNQYQASAHAQLLDAQLRLSEQIRQVSCL